MWVNWETMRGEKTHAYKHCKQQAWNMNALGRRTMQQKMAWAVLRLIRVLIVLYIIASLT